MLQQRRSVRLFLLLASLSVAAVVQGNLVTRYVPWRPEALAAINNMLDVHLEDNVILGCNNTVSNVRYSPSQTAYDNCDLGQFSMEIGACQSGHSNISLIILEGIPGGVQYQEGSVFYFTSTHGSDCVNGKKIALNVVAPPVSTTSTTATPTSTVGATATPSPVEGTTTTTTQPSTTPGGGGGGGGGESTANTGTTGTTSTASGSTDSVILISPTVAITVSSSPTPGGVDDTESQMFLDKLPFEGYLVFPLIAVVMLLLLCVLTILTVYYCHRKNNHRMKTLNSEEKGKHEMSMTEVETTNNDGYVKIDEYKLETTDGFTTVQNGKHDLPPPYKETNGSFSGPGRKPPDPPTATSSVKSAGPLPKKPDPTPVSKSLGPLTNGNKVSPKSGPSSLRSAPPPPSPLNGGGPKSLPARTDGRKQVAHRPPPPPSSGDNGPKSLPARPDGRRQAPRPPPPNQRSGGQQRLPPINK